MSEKLCVLVDDQGRFYNGYYKGLTMKYPVFNKRECVLFDYDSLKDRLKIEQIMEDSDSHTKVQFLNLSIN